MTAPQKIETHSQRDDADVRALELRIIDLESAASVKGGAQ
jgi:hypothetical protein